MHFLVDTIERKFPELLTFSDELMHVERAARVSVDQISKCLRVMEANIKNLETDLANNKIPLDEDDKFTEVMGVSFFSFQEFSQSPIYISQKIPTSKYWNV